MNPETKEDLRKLCAAWIIGAICFGLGLGIHDLIAWIFP